MATFARLLNTWYNKQARALPWRETRDPYKIWISEIMLQQTTVATVIPYYKRWVARFPTVEVLAKANLEDVLKLWQGLGYYQRARNLHKAALMICADFNGQIPRQPDQLKQLPGFGPYTVGAVLSIAFDRRYPIIDANVRRVIMRILARKGLANVSQDKDILVYLDQVMPQRNMRTFNQALMELGALVCRSREPLCSLCPIKSLCKAYQKGVQEIIPQTKKKVLKDVEVAVGVLKKGRKYFIQQRPVKGLLAGLWEFPGGKLEKGETPRVALKRELREEIGVEVTSMTHLMNIKHFYTQFRVHLHVFLCEAKPHPIEDEMHKFINYYEFSRYPLPSGSAKIVEKMRP